MTRGRTRIADVLTVASILAIFVPTVFVTLSDLELDELGVIGGALFNVIYVPYSFLMIAAMVLSFRARYRLELGVQFDRWRVFGDSVRRKYGGLGSLFIAYLWLYAVILIPMIVAFRSLLRMVTGASGGKGGWRMDGTIDFDARFVEEEHPEPSDEPRQEQSWEAGTAPLVEDQWRARWGGRRSK